MVSEQLTLHEPVLCAEVIEGLRLRAGDRVIDCTLGTGGHTAAILEAIGPTGAVLAFDRDPTMLARAAQRLGARVSQVTFVHANFADLGVIAPQHGFDSVSGIVADLGLSSLHLDDASRGFSFRFDAPLDMRYDPTGGRQSAQEIINTFSAEQLTHIFRTYGEERFASRISKKIEIIRKQKEIKTTRELAEIIASCGIPSKQKLHPATKVFQALRIFINDELGALTRMLVSIPRILVPGGRVAIISYHSLEDRIVKTYFKTHSELHTCTPERPCTCTGPLFTRVTRKALIPTDSEVARNPRSRSAKLRIAERTSVIAP